MGTDGVSSEVPLRPGTHGILTGLWISLLVLLAIYTRTSFVLGDGLLLFSALLVCVVVSEWPWRNQIPRQVAPFLQFMVSAVALFWVLSMFDTYSILRGTFPEGIEVTEMPDGVGGVIRLSPFMSGAWTMRRAVDDQLASACLPVFVLVAQVATASIVRRLKGGRSGAHGA